MTPPKFPPTLGDVFLRTASGVFLEMLSYDDLLQVIMGKVIDVTHATKGFLILVGPSDALEFKVARNMKREEIENPKNRISRNLIRQVVETRSSVLSGHAGEDPRFEDMESVQNLLIKSILCVPLKDDRQVFGVIYLENHITAGVFDQNSREVVERVAEEASLALGMARTLVSIKGERDRLEVENQSLREIFRSEHEFGRFVGQSAAMAKVGAQIAKIAESPHTALILGESGTGKELVARILHATGPRRAKPFVALNCAGVPSGLFESEIFGHVKGSFTGADRSRVGRVEAAEGGTLFLDEIGDLPGEVQPKLLRLLQERTYERVGETNSRRADIRVVAATHKDLRAEVERGRFREDLYFRLSILPLHLPPLRERPEDVQPLAEHFLSQEGRRIPGFTKPALDFMRQHPWRPGNVRSLRNVVARAAVYSADGEPIDVDVIRQHLDDGDGGPGRSGMDAALAVSIPIDLPYKEAVARLEETYLRALLGRHPELSRTELAGRIRIAKRTLFQKLREFGITSPDIPARDPGEEHPPSARG